MPLNISTHILDLNLGVPAKDVLVSLEKSASEKNGKHSWTLLASKHTNQDGRIVFQIQPDAGTYQLIFEIKNYLESKNQTPFFTVAPVIFEIKDTDRNYHVPLLLNLYGYSTYRGS